MRYPILKIYTEKIVENGQILIKECAKNGISLWAVTKGMSAHPEIALAFKKAGFQILADSRISNIVKMKEAGIQGEYALIRIPMPSEIEDTVMLCDYSLVSELDSVLEMSRICDKLKKNHKIVIMIDMGDLREGFWPTELESSYEKLKNISPYLHIAGVGANFACASGALPRRDNLASLLGYYKELENKLNCHFELVSGGGTCTLVQMIRGNIPEGINSLRLGESILLGTDSSENFPFTMLSQDTMEIVAELCEVRVKPTLPIGEIGMDFSGNVPIFLDRGNRLRGVLAIGKQDIRIEGLVPLDEGVEIITASSDHLLVDLEDCPKKYKAGDTLRFRPDYPAMLSASTSSYVQKIFC